MTGATNPREKRRTVAVRYASHLPSLVDRLNATLSAMMGHFQRLKTLISSVFGGDNKRDNDSDYGMGPNVVRGWTSIYNSAG